MRVIVKIKWFCLTGRLVEWERMQWRWRGGQKIQKPELEAGTKKLELETETRGWNQKQNVQQKLELESKTRGQNWELELEDGTGGFVPETLEIKISCVEMKVICQKRE